MSSSTGVPPSNRSAADPQATGMPDSLCPQCPLRGHAPQAAGSADPAATGGVSRSSDPLVTGGPGGAGDPDATGTRGLNGSPPSRPEVWRFGEDYEILERVAAGGMGVIYKARQIKANRLVALKMIQAGCLPSTEQKQRFVREAQAAADLHHPGIVTIHDVGEVNGQHYFSMEWLEGGSLKELLAEGPLPPRVAAELIRQAAEAVEHAHQRGIIHRDLKPGNIMLCRRPRSGSASTATAEPSSAGSAGGSRESVAAPSLKLVDFGLARFTAGNELSRTGMVLGTPSYMPPEQARGDLKAIGPWTDVYGLGAVLYQLLTGRPPFLSASEHETLRQVLEVEPVPPRQVNASVPSDLENICLKCLRKEPGQRYASAAELAEEVGRFLRGEPVCARPVGLAERTWKWCRRNRSLAGLLATLALVIVGSLLGMTVLYLNAKRREAGARAVTRFYEQHVLAAARPKGWAGGSGKDVTLREVLDQATPAIESAFTDQPELEAAVRHTLGMTYWYLGRFEAANPHLEKAHALRLERLGPDHPETLICLHDLAMQCWRQGHDEEATRLAREVLARRQRVLGPEHEETLWTQLNLGLFLMEAGQLDESETQLRQAIAACQRTLGRKHHHTLYGQNDLALVLDYKGDQEGSLELHRRTLAGRRETLGPEHFGTLLSLHNVAFSLKELGRLEEGEDCFRQAHEAFDRILGPEHFNTLLTESEMGDLLRMQGNHAESEKLLRHALAGWRKTLAPDNRSLAYTLTHTAGLLCETGRPAQAEPLLRESLKIQEKNPLSGDWSLPFTRNLLGASLASQGRFAEAEPLVLTGYEELSRLKGAPPNRIAVALDRVIELYDQWGKPKEAEAWRQKRPRTGK